jgi:hypothetical protein
MVNLATTKHILRKITMRMQCDEANATNLIKDYMLALQDMRLAGPMGILGRPKF